MNKQDELYKDKMIKWFKSVELEIEAEAESIKHHKAAIAIRTRQLKLDEESTALSKERLDSARKEYDQWLKTKENE